MLSLILGKEKERPTEEGVEEEIGEIPPRENYEAHLERSSQHAEHRDEGCRFST